MYDESMSSSSSHILECIRAQKNGEKYPHTVVRRWLIKQEGVNHAYIVYSITKFTVRVVYRKRESKHVCKEMAQR